MIFNVFFWKSFMAFHGLSWPLIIFDSLSWHSIPSFGLWQHFMAYNDLWLLFMAFDSFWWLFMVFDGPWCHFMAFREFCWLLWTLIVFDGLNGLCQHFLAYGDLWVHFMTFNSFWWPLMALMALLGPTFLQKLITIFPMVILSCKTLFYLKNWQKRPVDKKATYEAAL